MLNKWVPVEDRLPLKISLALLLASIVLFVQRITQGIWFTPFIDEWGNLVGGRMLDHGAILYRDFVDTHGPLIFALAQAYGALFGWLHPNYARLIQVVVAIPAIISVATIPGEPRNLIRTASCALLLGLLSVVWLIQGFYIVDYYAVGGFLFAVGLGAVIVPSWYGAPLTFARGFAGGVALVLAGAAAYYFVPACAALLASLVLAEVRKPDGRAPIAGLFCGIGAAVLAVALWFLIFGDFGGYLAFHIVETMRDFRPERQATFAHFLIGLLPSLEPFWLVNTLALLISCVSLGLMLAIDQWRPAETPSTRVPILLGWIGLISLLARGYPGIHNGVFVVATFALFAIALPVAVHRILPKSISRHWATPIIMIVLPVLIALVFAHGARYVNQWQGAEPDKPYDIGVSQKPLYRRIRELTRPDEPILVLPFSPDIYFAANRLPMDRYDAYFQFDGAYAKSPWDGHARDLCVDLPKTPPPIIYFMKNALVFMDPAYLDCVQNFLATHYRESHTFPGLFLRSDRPQARLAFLSEHSVRGRWMKSR